MRQFQRPSRAVICGAAAAALAVGAMATRQYFARPEFSIQEPRLLVARHDLPTGHPIHSLDLTMTPRALFPGKVPPGALTDQDLHLLKGAKVERAISGGGIVQAEMLRLSPSVLGLGASVPRGLRAYPIRPENTLHVASGDQVDVYWRSPTDEEPTRTIIESALVLQAGFRESVFEIVLALSDEEIRLVEKGRQKGKLTIALLNPQEPAAVKSRSRSWPRNSKKRSPKRIEIWSEDQ